ncbi:hypothetical protein AABB24_032924 [Solanum stoloniferum]|uniref:Uncharacterized protein n=1 Tax=Solanum stoloniferum TaxID=62892 RepID=A0ABD2RLV1_9SOLN
MMRNAKINFCKVNYSKLIDSCCLIRTSILPVLSSNVYSCAFGFPQEKKQNQLTHINVQGKDSADKVKHTRKEREYLFKSIKTSLHISKDIYKETRTAKDEDIYLINLGVQYASITGYN